jgi:hypothetical protein
MCARAQSSSDRPATVIQAGLRSRWRHDTAVDYGNTHYLPFVVVPNAGIKANEFTEILVLHTITRGYPPPAYEKGSLS